MFPDRTPGEFFGSTGNPFSSEELPEFHMMFPFHTEKLLAVLYLDSKGRLCAETLRNRQCLQSGKT